MKDRFQRGALVRVLTPHSDYFWLIGHVAEVTEFRDAGMIEFTEAELRRSPRPELLLRAQPRVHFYFRVLQGVDEYAE